MVEWNSARETPQGAIVLRLRALALVGDRQRIPYRGGLSDLFDIVRLSSMLYSSKEVYYQNSASSCRASRARLVSVH